MAGMLAGVECARRRRFPQSGGGGLPDSPRGGSPADRRISFCLYARNSKPIINSTPFMQRSSLSQAYCDDKLEDVAREAKERLDEKLRDQQPKSLTKRVFGGGQQEEGRNVQQNRATMIVKELLTEVVEMKKNGSKRLINWAKMMWKPTEEEKEEEEEEEECAVCLEQLKEGETLIKLPCAHSFHDKCVIPWLHNNSHCPCCRMEI